MQLWHITAVMAIGIAGVQANPVTHVVRQAASSSNGARIEQTAASLALPTATAQPDPDTGLAGVNDVDSNVTSWAYLWGWHGCSAGQKSAILNGLSEAHKVLGTDGVYNIQNHWNDWASVEYLGSPWYVMQGDRRGVTQHRFLDAYYYQQHWWSDYDTNVFCEADDREECANERSFIAVNNNVEGGLGLSFCARYFALGTLNGIYDAVSKGEDAPDLSEYENRARPWITAIMRIRWIADLTPQRLKFPGSGAWQTAESASQAKYLAKNSKAEGAPKKALDNPSNYAWYALAQWVQQKRGNYPFRPQTPVELAPAF